MADPRVLGSLFTLADQAKIMNRHLASIAASLEAMRKQAEASTEEGPA
jgi:hypothetical protein